MKGDKPRYKVRSNLLRGNSFYFLWTSTLLHRRISITDEERAERALWRVRSAYQLVIEHFRSRDANAQVRRHSPQHLNRIVADRDSHANLRSSDAKWVENKKLMHFVRWFIWLLNHVVFPTVYNLFLVHSPHEHRIHFDRGLEKANFSVWEDNAFATGAAETCTHIRFDGIVFYVLIHTRSKLPICSASPISNSLNNKHVPTSRDWYTQCLDLEKSHWQLAL